MKVLELSVMPDHVHAIVSIPSTLSVSKAFNLLKGASSHQLFERQPKFRLRYPRGHLWSPGKFYRSVGDADLQTLRNYVRGQAPCQATFEYF
jgi:putative transposase